jgi:hypothetical protein
MCALICVPTNARARSRRRTHGHGRGCWVGTRTRRWAFDRRRRLDDLRGCGRHLVLVLRSLLTLMTRREWSTWCRARQAAGRRSEWQWAAATPHGGRCLCLEHNLQDKRACTGCMLRGLPAITPAGMQHGERAQRRDCCEALLDELRAIVEKAWMDTRRHRAQSRTRAHTRTPRPAPSESRAAARSRCAAGFRGARGMRL